ncbi:DUF5058 family protein [Bacillus sp. JCM 19041]|uniref:DUF5058 family protein n=1 Tax=Bacillus sp. JCM 19041 TaxID=1460637 RepID=UPI000B3179C5
MDSTMELARSGSFWMFAIIVVLVVMVQSIVFFRLALRTSESVGLTDAEVKASVKSGAIASIGPSLGILIVAISLMSLIGDPLTLMRIGIVGSAPTESMGASIAAESVGTTLGTTSVTPEILSLVVWTLCLVVLDGS